MCIRDSLELTQSEQVRYKRLINDGPYNGGTYKDEFFEVTIHGENVSSSLPGEVFSFVRELRPTT